MTVVSHILHSEFSSTPYWWEEYRPEAGPLADVPRKMPVAIVGGGYAGLSCALELSRLGIVSVVFESDNLGAGASTRSGGVVGGDSHPSGKKKNHGSGVGDAEQAYSFLDQLIAREGIECYWEKRGRFVGAWTPGDHAIQIQRVKVLHDAGETGFRIVARADQREEIASDFYYGGLVAERSGKLHPALYYKGLLEAAFKAGVIVCAGAEVTGIKAQNSGWRLTTARGPIEVDNVVIATNGYTGELTPSLRRRLVPISRHVIATETLPPGLLNSLLPNGRAVEETQRVRCYYRVSPDRSRLIFGGCVPFTVTNPVSIAETLHHSMTERFPQLEEARVTHCWSGNVALTFDGLSHAGLLDGLHYALGCNGSGIAMMTLLGARTAHRIADKLLDGRASEQPKFPAVPLYLGDPSVFLPFVGTYYRMRDRISRAAADPARGIPTAGQP